MSDDAVGDLCFKHGGIAQTIGSVAVAHLTCSVERNQGTVILGDELVLALRPLVSRQIWGASHEELSAPAEHPRSTGPI
jgi:hypothetical protein